MYTYSTDHSYCETFYILNFCKYLPKIKLNNATYSAHALSKHYGN